ncbi:hypothetical protein T492DRAFT_1090966 [Pavlovales sp. CCMP2436]|nr:hypothetical protein T492DRAFT_1090966 [Pavlovales sp. CCMP2436]
MTTFAITACRVDSCAHCPTVRCPLFAAHCPPTAHCPLLHCTQLTPPQINLVLYILYTLS